jgi:hypothetical protein
MECDLETNKSACNCTYRPCARKGKCCQCIAYHLRFEELPACCFTSEVERTYDRSFAGFARIHGSS